MACPTGPPKPLLPEATKHRPLVQVATREATAKYVAEFVGTYAVVLTAGCNSALGRDPTVALWAPISSACTLLVCTYALGRVPGAGGRDSGPGANFNPAVTLTFAACGRLEPLVAVGYCLVQVTAGLLAGVHICLMFQGGPDLGPRGGSNWRGVGLVEIIFTTVLCFVVLNCMASRRNHPEDDKNQFSGLAAGAAFGVGMCAAGGVSGAVLNPAIALAMEVSSSSFGYSLPYLVFHAIAGLLAAALFKVVRPEEFQKPSEAPLLMELATPGLAPRVASEAVGTFVLVFTVAISHPQSAPFAAAAAMMCMVYSLKTVSGAYFNPAVTLGVILSGRCIRGAREGSAYALAQLFAGAAAASLASIAHGGSSLPLVLWDRHWFAIAVAEVGVTCVLTLVAIAVGTVTAAHSMSSQNNMIGLAVGACVIAGGLAVGSIAPPNTPLNLAVCLAFSEGQIPGGWGFLLCLGYLGCQLLGGALAALLYCVIRPTECQPDVMIHVI